MKNVLELIHNPVVRELQEALGEDAQLHLVGGIVRDCLLNKSAKDLDLATRLTPAQMIERLEAAGIKFIPTGIRRGTITALVQGEPVEITTFRNPKQENVYTETIEEDLVARDFTVNAIALRVSDGTLVDPFDGIGDLAKRLVKAVGVAQERFKEDPHRMLRMVRFGALEGWTVDPDTLAAAKECHKLLWNVSVERINAELVKIVTSDQVMKAFQTLAELNLLEAVIPELLPSVGFEQNKYHAHDVFTHILMVVSAVPKSNKIVRLAALFHDIGKPASLTVEEDGARRFLGHEDVGAIITRSAMRRLKFSNDDLEQVVKLVKFHMFSLDAGPKAVRRLMKQMGDQFEDLVELKRADWFGGRILGFDLDDKWSEFEKTVEKAKVVTQTHKLNFLAIRGEDVLSLGIKPGPLVGKILAEVGELVMDEPELNDRDTLLNLLPEIIQTVTSNT